MNVRAIVHGRVWVCVCVYVQDHVNAGVHVVTDENANAVALVYDLVNVHVPVAADVQSAHLKRANMISWSSVFS